VSDANQPARTPSVIGMEHARRCVREAALAGFDPRLARLAALNFAAAFIARASGYEATTLMREFESMVESQRRALAQLKEAEASAED